MNRLDKTPVNKRNLEYIFRAKKGDIATSRISSLWNREICLGSWRFVKVVSTCFASIDFPRHHTTVNVTKRESCHRWWQSSHTTKFKFPLSWSYSDERLHSGNSWSSHRQQVVVTECTHRRVKVSEHLKNPWGWLHSLYPHSHDATDQSQAATGSFPLHHAHCYHCDKATNNVSLKGYTYQLCFTFYRQAERNDSEAKQQVTQNNAIEVIVSR